jgi:ribA/ribD-fused uncharacterized protein
MSYYLFLDDARTPKQVTWAALPENVSWVQARSYNDFSTTIWKLGIPKYVAYDCDLCEEHYNAYFNLKELYVREHDKFKTKCGLHCIKLMLEVCAKLNVDHPPYVIHTRNNFAEPAMRKMIEDYNQKRVKPAFSPTQNQWDNQDKPPEYAVHDDKVINGFFGPYRFLSNFWPAEVTWQNITFPSVEVAYQAIKSANPADLDSFVGLTAAEAKRKGKTITLRPRWDDLKLFVMGYLVMQKFSKYPELKRLLIGTGERQLIEANAWKDKYWGSYHRFENGAWFCYGGQNHLGRILMDTRSLLS